MGVWREEDHPRGEDGRFIDKINAFLKNHEKIPLSADGKINFLQMSYIMQKPEREDLTRAEWARWYNRIYEITQMNQ